MEKFVPPTQRKKLTWTINSDCNFKCPYCPAPTEQKIKMAKKDNFDIGAVINFLDKQGTWDIHLIGGEPFLHPKFIELCQLLTKKHYIGLDTNLSSPLVFEFADKINPEKVAYISCSLQITELRRLNMEDSFIEKFLYLKKKGFNLSSSLVTWPPFIHEFEKIVEKYRSKGIEPLRPILFKGTYNGKEYPKSFTQKEIDLFEKHSSKMLKGFNPDLNKRNLTFEGIPCLAGKNYIRIDTRGRVTRCRTEEAPIGNIFKDKIELFKNIMPCRSKVCECLWEGYRFAQGEPQKNINFQIEKIKDRIKNLSKESETTIFTVDKKFHDLPYMHLEMAKKLRDLFFENDIKGCLELGFFQGKSSAFIAAILNEMGRGHLTTIDLLSILEKKPTIKDVLKDLNLEKFVTYYFEPRSYTWRLMKMIEKNPKPIFDFCYIDGGHNWDNTGFAFFLVDKLLRPGGWIVFDDLYYNIEENAKKPGKQLSEWAKKLPEEERKTCQIFKVWKLLVKQNSNYHNFKESDQWGFAQKKT